MGLPDPPLTIVAIGGRYVNERQAIYTHPRLGAPLNPDTALN